MSSLTVYANIEDGHAAANNATYSTAKTAATSVDNTGLTFNVGQWFFSAAYNIYEGFISFDASAIADTSLVTAATLDLNVSALDASGSAFTLKVGYRSAWTPPLDTSDWVNSGTIESAPSIDAAGCSIASGSIATSAYNVMTLSNLSNISLTAKTKFLAYTDRMVSSSAPPGAEYVTINSADTTGTTSDPRLVITYTDIPGAPSPGSGTGPMAKPTSITSIDSNWSAPGSGGTPTGYKLERSPNTGPLYLPGASGAYASSPDSNVLDMVGDIDFRAKVAFVDWTPGALSAIVTKWGASGQRSYMFTLENTGVLGLYWTANGSTQNSAFSTVATGVADGATKWVRVTMDVDNGATQRDIKFWTSNDGVSWTQLGTTVTQAGVTSIFASTAQLEIGSQNSGVSFYANATFYQVQLRSNILDDGTGIVFDANFATAQIAPAFLESSSNAAAVTINGTAVMGVYAQIVDQAGLGYTDSGLSPGLTYWYRVRAYNAAGNGPYSAAYPGSTSQYEVEVFADSPTMHCRLDEPAPGTGVALDRTNSSRDGAYVASPLTAVGLIGSDPDDNAVALNGSTQWITWVYNPFSVSASRTFEGWAKRGTNTTTDTLFGGAGTNNVGLRIMLNTTDIKFSANWTGDTVGVTWTGVAPAPGVPFHWALTYNDSTKAAELFINGVSQGSLTVASGYSSPGALRYGVRSTNTDPFDGTLDEAAVYGSILSATRILAHYNAGIAGRSPVIVGPSYAVHRASRW